MKKIMFLLIIAYSTLIAKAQWSPPATNIWNTNTGTVGIGTTTPNTAYKLNVEGNTRISSGTGYIDLLPSTGGIELAANTIPAAYIDFKGQNYLSSDFRARIIYVDNGGLYFQTGGIATTRLFISDATGQVGVGTITPTLGFTMEVSGSARVSSLGGGRFDVNPAIGQLTLKSDQIFGF